MSTAILSIAAQARRQGLPVLGAALAGAGPRSRLGRLLGRPSRPDALLLAPPTDEPLRALGQMLRRGLDPSSLATFLPWLGRRPLEAALVAWDALTGSLVAPEDGALLAVLRETAEAALPLLPGPGERGVDTRRVSSSEAAEMIAEPARGRRSTDELLAALADHDVGAYEVLRRRGPAWRDVLRRTGVLEGTRSFAQLLHLAHLPTLASFYLDYLWHGFGYLPALADLCEVMLDAGAADRLPAPTVDGPGAEALIEYVACRAAIVRGDAAWAYGRLEARALAARRAAAVMRAGGVVRGQGPGLNPRDDRLVVVRAELSARAGECNVPLDDVDAIARARPSWRYAARVRALCAQPGGAGDEGPVRARTDDPAEAAGLAALAMEHLDAHLHLFGNDEALWRDVVDAPAHRPELLGRLAREATYLPHERAPWIALALLVAPQHGLEPLEEVESLALGQSALDGRIARASA